MTGEGAQNSPTPEPRSQDTGSTDTRMIIDQTWQYPGYFGCESHCRLRVYEPPTPRALVVIFTEMTDNPGTSITNRIEALATGVWTFLERPDRQVVYVEHYPDSGVYNPYTGRWQFPEHFDFIEFAMKIDGAFAKPRWLRTSRQTVEALIGQPI